MQVDSPRRVVPRALLEVLGLLWLREPDEQLIQRAMSELGLPVAKPEELAIAYSDLFLLNVYPYASVFLEPGGEMNGARAVEMAAFYEQNSYVPLDLTRVAGADHIGLMLGAAGETGNDRSLSRLLDWAPVLCLAVERAPNAQPFYQALAARTRELLLQAKLESNQAPQFTNPEIVAPEDQELSLRAIVRYLLAPARSGVFITRAQFGMWARALGAPLAFGERFQVALQLLEVAGAQQSADRVLDWLGAEVRAWDAAYAQWAGVSDWAYASLWRERTARTRSLLDEMKWLLATAPGSNGAAGGGRGLGLQ